MTRTIAAAIAGFLTIAEPAHGEMDGIETVIDSALQQLASSGDIPAQRHIANCHRDGCGGPTDPVMACAWRIVIVASGDPSVTMDDVERRRADCESLDSTQQRRAAAEAQAIFLSVYQNELVLPADFFGSNRMREPRR